VKPALLSGSAYSLGAVLYSTAALLLAGKLLTNTLPPAGVGQVALAILAAEFLGMAGGLGLPAALPRLIAGAAGAARGGLYNRLLRVQLVAALYVALLAAVALMARPWWPPSAVLLLPTSPWLIAALPPLALAVALRDFLLAAAAGHHAYGRRALALIAMATLQVALFALLYRADTAPPIAFVAAHAVSALAGAALLFTRVPRAREPGGEPDPAAAKLALRFAAPLYVNNLMNFIYQRVDTLLIAAWLGLGAAAIFEMAKRLPNLLSRLLRAALVPYLPALSELLRDGKSAGASALVWRASGVAAFSGYAVTLAALALGEPLLAALFTEDYRAGAVALGLLLAATTLAVQAGILGQALIALDRPRQVMNINLGLAALSLLFNVILVPRFGMAGAGWSAVLAAAFSLILQGRAVVRAGIPRGPRRHLLVHLYFVLAAAGGAAFGMAPRLGLALVFVAACLLSGLVPLGRREARP